MSKRSRIWALDQPILVQLSGIELAVQRLDSREVRLGDLRSPSAAGDGALCGRHDFHKSSLSNGYDMRLFKSRVANDALVLDEASANRLSCFTRLAPKLMTVIRFHPRHTSAVKFPHRSGPWK